MPLLGNHNPTDRRSRRSSPRILRISRGFTLIETALAIVIVGVGVISIMAAQAAFHQQNSWSTHAAIASQLGNEIRELTFNLPHNDPVTGTMIDPDTGTIFWGPETNETFLADFDDLDDFDGGGAGLIFSADSIPVNGPLNARGEVIQNMDGWSQIVTVRNVDPFDLSTVVADGASEVMIVEVRVTYQAPGESTPTDMTTVSWVAP